MSDTIKNALPCPFCGCPGDNLILTSWFLNEGEVDAYECPVCFAGAPVDSWNKRAEQELPA